MDAVAFLSISIPVSTYLYAMNRVRIFYIIIFCACFVIVSPASLVAETMSKTAWNYYQSGEKYEEAGNTHLAIIKYLAAIKSDPSFSEPYSSLGLLYVASEQYQSAISNLKTYIKLEPKEPLGWCSLGQAYFSRASSAKYYSLAKGDYDRAKYNFDYAAKLAPNNSYILAWLGLYYHHQEDYRRAIKQYQQALKSDGNNEAASYLLAVCFKDQGETDRYLRQIILLEKLNPTGEEAEQEITNARKSYKYRLDQMAKENYRKGMEYFKNKQYPQTISEMERILEIDRNNFEALQLMGRAYYHTQDYENAKNAYFKAKQIKPGEYSVRGNLGYFYYALRDYDSAEKELKAAISINPSGHQAHYWLAMLYYNINDKLNYIKELKITEKIDRSFMRTGELLDIIKKEEHNKRLAVDYRDQGLQSVNNDRLEEGVKYFLKSLEYDSESYVSHLALGKAYSDLGRYDEANQALVQALEIYPEGDVAHIYLARIYKSQGLNVEYYAQLEKGLKFNPRNKEITDLIKDYDSSFRGYLKEGDGYIANNQATRAVEEYGKAVSLYPESYEANFLLGSAYLQTNSYGKSLEYLNKAIELKPREAKAVNARGEVYFQQGKIAEANTEFKKALVMDRNFIPARLNLAIASERAGDFKKYYRELKNIVRIDNNQEEVNRRLGVIETQINEGIVVGEDRIGSGEFHQAIGRFEEILEFDDQHFIALLRIGYCFHKIGDDDQAISYFRQSINVDSSVFEPHYYLGDIYSSKDPEQAAIHFEKATQLRPDYEDAHIKLAMAYAASGANRDYIITLRRILEINPLNEMAATELQLWNQKESDS